MSNQELAAEVSARIGQTQAQGLNAMLDWSPTAIRAEAAHLDNSPVGPLTGIAVAIKDNIATAELKTTCASRMLEGYQSPFDATVVSRLREAGALLVGKTNMDEFAMGSSTEHSAFGRVQHPIFPDRVPGGSSGGSAAIVAAGAVPVALGSETGGSVRQPAAYCGLVGIKPTYGRVSRNGLVAFGSSLDCISICSNTVANGSATLQVISGHDPRDATTLKSDPMAGLSIPRSLQGMVIGLPEEYFPKNLHPGVQTACDRTAALLRELGAEIRKVSLPHTRYAVPAYYIVNPAEAAANLARFDGVRYGRRRIGPEGDIRALYQATRGEGFGAEVRRRIMLGTFVLSAGYASRYYSRAQVVRNLITEDFSRVFASGVDLLLTPTVPTPAFRAGEKMHDPVAMYQGDVFVCTSSLSGNPALSLPVGRDEGLPLGVQLIARHFDEATMLNTAALLEANLDATVEVR